MSGVLPRAAAFGLACALVPMAGCYASHVRLLEVADDAALDAGRRDAGRDAGGAHDGGTTVSCATDDARAVVCPTFFCDDGGAWQWNGDRCFYIACGACEGTACGSGTSTQAACERNHASCEPSLCRATDGEWLFGAMECGNFECGHRVEAICEIGFAVCDCGPARSFRPGVGCFTDPACPMDPPRPSREVLCTSSGGSWESICCDSVCGQPCAAACAADACNCGPDRVFDEVRGCLGSSRCFERRVGETCGPRSRCEPGTICCQTCGGAGCYGDPTCRAPICDTDSHLDECGNSYDWP